jgi:hypothetical protein
VNCLPIKLGSNLKYHFAEVSLKLHSQVSADSGLLVDLEVSHLSLVLPFDVVI